MSEMSIRERMEAAYHNRPLDRVALGIYNGYLPRGQAERRLRGMGLGIIDYHPLTSMLAPPWHLKDGFISEVKGAEPRVDWRWENGQKLEQRTYTTPVGTVTQVVRKDPAYASDWIAKHYIRTAEDYKIVQYIVENTVFRRQESPWQAKRDLLGDDGVVLGRLDRSPFQKVMYELAGPERFLVDLQVTPGPAEELLATIDRRLAEPFEMALDSESEIIWQPDNITSDMTPPEYFGKYCLPFYAKHGRRFRDAGKTYVVHMDGKLAALTDLISESTFDVVESFSLPIIGGDMTLTEARAAWPGKVILPNFPSSVCHRSDQQIEAFMESFLAEAGPDVPMMLQISENLPAGQWPRVLPILCKVINRRGDS